jgi:hypothetical protein
VAGGLPSVQSPEMGLAHCVAIADGDCVCIFTDTEADGAFHAASLGPV